MQTETNFDGWFPSPAISLSLAEIERLLRGRRFPVCGFIVSQAFVDRMNSRHTLVDDPAYKDAQNSYVGIPFVVDPAFGPTDVEFATTPAAWQKRCRELAEGP